MGAITKFINQTERFNESNVSGIRKKWGSLASHKLKEINQFTIYQHLKMERLHYPKFMLRQSNYM